jgi:hypothetical protein
MPVLGLGLHILVALFFAVHAVRSGQQMYWLMILFSFPLFGSIVYFLVIYLPNSRLEYGARKAVAAAARSLDPTRELREARSLRVHANRPEPDAPRPGVAGERRRRGSSDELRGMPQGPFRLQ